MKNNKSYSDSIGARTTDKNNGETLFLLSPSDVGIRRNNGRNGSRFGPQVIFKNFLKLNSHLEDVHKISTITVSDQEREKVDFHQAQMEHSQKILESLECERKNILHIGGGHDHAYPLLKAIEDSKKFKKILIINVDAHCDTRVEEIRHSGTPFRDFDNSTKIKVQLIQYGIHNYSNSSSTLSPLKNIDQKVINHPSSFYLDEGFIDDSTFVYLSLDADGLDSSVMRAVSAVNPNGLSIQNVEEIIQKVKSLCKNRAFGIYEYNPVYDDLSNQGAKVISHLMYKWLE